MVIRQILANDQTVLRQGPGVTRWHVSAFNWLAKAADGPQFVQIIYQAVRGVFDRDVYRNQ